MKISLNDLRNLIDVVTGNEIYPEIRTISGSSTDPKIIVDGRQVLLFCSPNYLGLSNHPKVCAAAIAAIERYGVGTNGSALVSGYLEVHKNLERTIADFMNSKSAIFFNSVTLANMGVITSVIDPPLRSFFPSLMFDQLKKRAIFCDRENHASLFNAIKLTRIEKTYIYRHNDMDHLESLLKRSDHVCKLIVTDGYFSMSADLAPLPKIVHLAEKYSAMVFVDDAHGTGVLGPNGRGTAEYFGVEESIHFSIGSLAKAFGVRGGFVCGEEKFIKYLRVSARGYVFSGTLPGAIPAATLAAMEIAKLEPWRRERVLENAAYLRTNLKKLGCQVMGEVHIVPWLIGDDGEAVVIARELLEAEIFAPCIRYPAVAKDQARIRFIPMATHTQKHLDRLLEVCEVVGKRHKIL